ncbi:hypothetical protein GCM10027566_39170 [Arachidicoccus ginsenosidivorans]|uniref:hypothetical protein n=1 Tax=Arachidicoccus ginsenosidivorans TaxID=496057 RepID=UPI001CEF88B0|nr:hypothetical protein [Arachidicoccus ginsenosidivorans]
MAEKSPKMGGRINVGFWPSSVRFYKRARNEFGKSTYKRDKNGNVVIGKEKKGVPLSDIWEIPYLNPKAKE